MATTQQMREAYPEPLVGTTVEGHPRCDHSMGVRVRFPSALRDDGEVAWLVHPAQVDAWAAFAAVMRSVGYLIRDPDSGTANCRNIAGKPFGATSLHAHLSAIDLNPATNSGTRTDQPKALQRGVAAIRTRGGVRVFRNLPDDRMHWQIDCLPADLAVGIDPSGGHGAATAGAAMAQMEGMEMDKNTWKKVQRALQTLARPLYVGGTVDGFPGPKTDEALKTFERRRKLSRHGVMGRLRDPNAGMWPATRELLFLEALVRS